MATRSTISALGQDGKIRTIYSHWDGYPTHHGVLLETHYNTAEMAEALVSLGAISSLGENLAPEDGQPHTFENPAEGVTVAYHRDRGEDFQQSVFGSTVEYLLGLRKIGEEYDYFWNGEVWHLVSVNYEGKLNAKIQLLSEVI